MGKGDVRCLTSKPLLGGDLVNFSPVRGMSLDRGRYLSLVDASLANIWCDCIRLQMRGQVRRSIEANLQSWHPTLAALDHCAECQLQKGRTSQKRDRTAPPPTFAQPVRSPCATYAQLGHESVRVLGGKRFWPCNPRVTAAPGNTVRSLLHCIREGQKIQQNRGKPGSASGAACVTRTRDPRITKRQTAAS
jgi:hypothetical protein